MGRTASQAGASIAASRTSGEELSSILCVLVRPIGEFRRQQQIRGDSHTQDADPQHAGRFLPASSIREAESSRPASSSPVPLAAVQELGWNTVQRSSFTASSIHETDSDATASRGSPIASRPPAGSNRSGTMKGAVLALALAGKPAAFHPGMGGPEPGDMRILPASVVVPRRSWSMRGELMHVFVSYRVATEGMVLLACTLCRDLLPCCTLVR